MDYDHIFVQIFSMYIIHILIFQGPMSDSERL